MNLSLIPCFAFATRGTPVSLPDTLRVILPMAGSGSIAAVAGLLFSWPHNHKLVQLFFGAFWRNNVGTGLSNLGRWNYRQSKCLCGVTQSCRSTVKRYHW
jgi:hypothetical protein